MKCETNIVLSHIPAIRKQADRASIKSGVRLNDEMNLRTYDFDERKKMYAQRMDPVTMRTWLMWTTIVNVELMGSGHVTEAGHRTP